MIENCNCSNTSTWSWAASEKPVRFFTHMVSGDERGLEEPETWSENWGVARSCYTDLGKISCDSTTCGESIQISPSLKLRAPALSSDANFPKFVSIDSFLEPDREYRGYHSYRIEQSSREKARLHFVVLGMRTPDMGGSLYYQLGFGIILAPSKLYPDAFVRLGIWSDSDFRLKTSHNLDVKNEYIIV
jgi:hypothetical protein